MSKVVIAIGACATAGGIQALRNFRDVEEFTRVVYANPRFIDTLKTSTPISHHVTVEYELRGCPIAKHQLIEILSAYLNGRKPNLPQDSVCLECKRRGNVCVMVSRGEPCMGPVVHAGCGAICPSFNRGCYGCFGPMKSPNTAALTRRWKELGVGSDELVRSFRGFNAFADEFRLESDYHERAKKEE